MLYLVATPIGNLSDITLRALDVLKACDYILCEDTRHSRILLKHYEIEKPLKSHHQFNEVSKAESILSDLKKGLHIALISDAGTPAIADPGRWLVERCHQEAVAVTVVPGPCALIAALTLTGLQSQPFQFVGFLPKERAELNELLFKALNYPGVTICYETPHRIIDRLNIISTLAFSKDIYLVKEITKIHEQLIKGSAEHILKHLQNNGPPRGEMTLLLQGTESPLFSEHLTAEQIVKTLQTTYGLSLKQAIKAAACFCSQSRKDIYKTIHC